MSEFYHYTSSFSLYIVRMCDLSILTSSVGNVRICLFKKTVLTVFVFLLLFTMWDVLTNAFLLFFVVHVVIVSVCCRESPRAPCVSEWVSVCACVWCSPFLRRRETNEHGILSNREIQTEENCTRNVNRFQQICALFKNVFLFTNLFSLLVICLSRMNLHLMFSCVLFFKKEEFLLTVFSLTCHVQLDVLSVRVGSYQR